MANQKEMMQLQAQLQAQPVLSERGFRFELAGPEELAVFRGQHLRALWRCAHGSFTWTPSGYTEPIHSVRDPGAALRYTLVALATSD